MALALLGTGAVFAATPPAPATAANAATAMPAAHNSMKDCAAEATHKKLAGKARTDFIKKCESGAQSK